LRLRRAVLFVVLSRERLQNFAYHSQKLSICSTDFIYFVLNEVIDFSEDAFA